MKHITYNMHVTYIICWDLVGVGLELCLGWKCDIVEYCVGYMSCMVLYSVWYTFRIVPYTVSLCSDTVGIIAWYRSIIFPG